MSISFVGYSFDIGYRHMSSRLCTRQYWYCRKHTLLGHSISGSAKRGCSTQRHVLLSDLVFLYTCRPSCLILIWLSTCERAKCRHPEVCQPLTRQLRAGVSPTHSPRACKDARYDVHACDSPAMLLQHGNAIANKCCKLQCKLGTSSLKVTALQFGVPRCHQEKHMNKQMNE